MPNPAQAGGINDAAGRFWYKRKYLGPSEIDPMGEGPSAWLEVDARPGEIGDDGKPAYVGGAPHTGGIDRFINKTMEASPYILGTLLTLGSGSGALSGVDAAGNAVAAGGGAAAGTGGAMTAEEAFLAGSAGTTGTTGGTVGGLTAEQIAAGAGAGSQLVDSGGSAASTTDATWGANPQTTYDVGDADYVPDSGADPSWNMTDEQWASGGDAGYANDLSTELEAGGPAPQGVDPSAWEQAKQLYKDYPEARKLIGTLLSTGAGMIGSNRQANALADLAARYEGFGAPSRARFESSYAPGFTMANDPGYTDALNSAAKGTLHGLSVQGNPAGSPNAWAQSLSDLNAKFAYPALQNYRAQNANAGGISSFGHASVAPAMGEIGARSNVWQAAGSGAADIFNPRRSLTDILREAGY